MIDTSLHKLKSKFYLLVIKIRLYVNANKTLVKHSFQNKQKYFHALRSFLCSCAHSWTHMAFCKNLT